MTINYTTLLGLAQPVTGTEQGTWGTVVNDSVTALIEDAIANQATASVTGGDWTLTTTGSGVANQARCAILVPTGSPGVSRNIIAPSQSKAYFVINQSDGAVVVKGAATTGVSIAAGKSACVAWNGSDFVKVSSNELVNLASGVTGTLPVGNGGTGITSGTSGGVPYYSASNTIASSAALAASAIVVGGGAGVAPSTITTGTGVTTALGVNTGTAGAFVVNGGALGTPSSGTVTNLTGTASININGTVGATTPTTGVFTQVDITAQGDLRLQDTAGGEYVAIQAPGVLGASYTLTLPTTDGDASQFLQTDGSGVLSWATPAAADVTAAGNNAFTGANTFYNNTGQTFGTATTAQDGFIITGRAGGTSTYRVTFTPDTLTGNRTITFPNATGTVGLLGTAQTWTAVQTLTDPALIGTILEDVYTIVDGAAFEVDPGNGSVQLITLGASRTPKATNFAAGEAITLMVDDGSAYTITWTDATWGGTGVVWLTDSGVAPTLATTGYTAIVLWKVGTQVYGARVGNNA